MAPKTKITKVMILNTVLTITREKGFEAVNARSIAGKLQCSTRPIFTCYENMDELKKEFLDFAYDFYEQYVASYKSFAKISSVLVLPLSYLKFAMEETHLFKLLFIDDMDLNMREPKEFYKEPGNEKKAKIFSEAVGADWDHGKVIFLDLFLYTHGMAVLTATKKLSFDEGSAETMLTNLISALIRQEKTDGDGLCIFKEV